MDFHNRLKLEFFDRAQETKNILCSGLCDCEHVHH